MGWNHQPVNHFQDHNLGGIPVYLEKWRLIIDTVTDSAFSLGTWKWPIYDSSWRCPLESRQAPSPSWRPLALPLRRHGSLVKEPVAMLRMLIESEQVHQAGWFPLESGFQFMLTSSSSSPPSALFVCPTFRKGHSNIFQPLLRIPVFLWCIPTSKKEKTNAISYSSKTRICINFWLVVWNMAFIFPYIGNVIIPTDNIFSEG